MTEGVIPSKNMFIVARNSAVNSSKGNKTVERLHAA
jgi:hypothetical protein